MRPLRKAILAGAAAFALVAVAGLAAAEIKNAHLLEVRLPDGSLSQIQYVGDTPPTVSIAPPPMALSVHSPTSDPFGPESPFTEMERISQAMNRQAEEMLRAANAQTWQPGPGDTQIDVGKLPSGAQRFSMVSTISENGVCTRSVQYRFLGDGKSPQVVTRTSGDCVADDGKRPTPLVTTGSAATERAGQHQI